MKTDFNFSDPELLETLKHWKNIRYIGNAMSDFQAQPFFFTPERGANMSSDWEFELLKRMSGSHSGIIKGAEATRNMPNFHSHMEEYVRRSKELGENAFRFSLDFGRLCPEEGEFNETLMARYVKMMALIRSAGHEPILTLYHWPVPRFLVKYDQRGRIMAGGWEHPDALKHFRFYIENVVKFLGNKDKVRVILEGLGFGRYGQDQLLDRGLIEHFITINEPTNVVIDGYIAGVFPPFKRMRFSLMKKVVEKLVQANDVAYNQIKEGIIFPEKETQIGVAHNWTHFDGLLGKTIQSSINERVTDAFECEGDRTDFIGFQYYCRVTFPSLYRPIGPFHPKGRHYGTHPGHGDVYPEGLYKSLKRLHEMYPRKEIFITEFGFPEEADKKRPYWILETLGRILRSKREGVPIKGMLLWSLVNNFEWERGMEQKFGLFSEEELSKPLIPSEGNEVRSWEVWRAITKVIADPSPETLTKLQNWYEKAKRQFEMNI